VWPLTVLTVLAAGDETTPPGSGDLKVILGGVIVAGITAFGGIVVASINSRGNRSTAPAVDTSPPAQELTGLHEELAVLRFRADDNDERDDVQDRRHNVSEGRQERTEGRVADVERYLDHHDPRWRQQ
jgi:hypothetical protein